MDFSPKWCKKKGNLLLMVWGPKTLDGDVVGSVAPTCSWTMEEKCGTLWQRDWRQPGPGLGLSQHDSTKIEMTKLQTQNWVDQVNPYYKP